MPELNRIHNWVDAIIHEDGEKLSPGSLKTFKMIKDRASEQSREIVELRRRSREKIDELEKEIKQLKATLVHTGKDLL